MPAFYTKRLRTDLKEVIEEQLKQPAEDQVSFMEEIALMMTVAEQTVVMYELTTQGNDESLKQEAGANMCNAFKPIIDAKTKMASVFAAMKDKLSAHDVMFLVDRMIEAIYLECEAAGHREIAEALVPRIRELSKIAGPEGTALTPDSDMSAMIDSVPLVEDDPFKLEDSEAS
jgi:hypothetical protein